MPDLDGGHFFFTALIPIDNTGVVKHGDFTSSPVHMVRDALEALPTALQSPASEKIGIQSPFARSLRTHFLRLFVIDAAYYNGRNPQNAILEVGVDLLKAQPVDELTAPYLAFVADFDPEGVEPGAWLAELWTLAKPELCSVFEYCYGFDKAFSPEAFAAYVARGKIETTMPFNDYWTIPPPLPTMPLWPLLAPPVLGLVAGGLIAVLAHWPWWIGVPLALILASAGVYLDYAYVMAQGAKPFPTAPNSTLRHVLKALYLQRAFARFAALNQGQSPEALQAAFTAFLAQVRPDDLAGPTQSPGVIR